MVGSVESPLNLAADQNPATLNTSSMWWILAVLCVLILGSGLIVVFGRSRLSQNITDPGKQDQTVVRSWLAVVLVGGLLLFCAVSFTVGGAPRDTLLGALAAGASSVVGFYFASKSAEKARQDVMSMAGGGLVTVPKLTGMTVQEARTHMSTEPLRLTVESGATDTDTVKDQHPQPNSRLPHGGEVFVVTS